MRTITFFALILSLSLFAKPKETGGAHKIYGGYSLEQSELLGVVAIGIKHCSGTLISPTEVLTAAHCFVSKLEDIDDPKIRNINHKVWIGDKESEQIGYKISYVVIHPKFNNNEATYDNYDLAYVKLSKSVSELSEDEFFEVMTKNESQGLPNRMSLIAGFGLHDQESDAMRFAALTTVNRETKAELFIGGQGTSICFGDSGGPALIQVNGKMKLVGITSRTSSFYISAPQVACRDEGIFGKAYLAMELAEAQRLIDRGLRLKMSSLLIQAEQQYPEASWASFWLNKNSIKSLHLMPWNDSIKLNNSFTEKLARAQGFYRKRFLTKASEYVELALTIRPNNIDAIILHAKLTTFRKSAHEALKVINKGLRQDHDNEELLLLKAENLLQYTNFEEANQILNSLPDSPLKSIIKLRGLIINGQHELALESLQQAIELNADLNRVSPNNATLLKEALAWGALVVAEELINQRVNLNFKSPDGGLINTAASRGQTHLVRLMIINGANVDAPDSRYGLTALHLAADKGHLEVVRILVAYEANVHARSAYRQKPIDMARKSGHTKVVEYLSQF